MANGNSIAKICCRCKKEKTKSEFHKSSSRGVQAYCKPCKNSMSREWLKRNPHKVQEYNAREKASGNTRNGHLRRNYGIAPEQYDQTLIKWGGRCMICRQKPKDNRDLSVDHDHKTDLNRGLLCLKCNSAMERLDSIYGWALLAESYLEAPPGIG